MGDARVHPDPAMTGRPDTNIRFGSGQVTRLVHREYLETGSL